MSLHYDNVRPLLRREVSHPRSYGRPAKVIPLHPHLHGRRPWPVVGYSLLAITTAILIAGMLVVALRSGNDVLGRLVPGWPWW